LGADRADRWEASGELPGVLNWALGGLDLLLEQRGFRLPKVCAKLLEQHRRDSDPMSRLTPDSSHQTVARG
jgi:hypothetical protein